MVNIRINCKYNDQGAWCFNKEVKRSLFGFGARCCIIYPNYTGKCEHQIKYPKPIAPPPPPQKRYGS
jgi:hypothetical protein